MKLLAITALLVAGALAVPAASYPPPPPPDYGDIGYPSDPKGDGDGHGHEPPPPPPPPPGYGDGGSDEPPTDGDGYPADGGDDGDDSDGGGHGGDGERSGSNVCAPLLHSDPVCCSAGVLDLVSLDCHTPTKEPRDAEDFKNNCARDGGMAAKCCTLVLLGLGVLCRSVPGG